MTHFINGFLLSLDSIHRGTEGWQYPPPLSVTWGEPATLSCHFKVKYLRFRVQWFKMKVEKQLIHISPMIDGGGHAPPVFVGNHGVIVGSTTARWTCSGESKSAATGPSQLSSARNELLLSEMPAPEFTCRVGYSFLILIWIWQHLGVWYKLGCRPSSTDAKRINI